MTFRYVWLHSLAPWFIAVSLPFPFARVAIASIWLKRHRIYSDLAIVDVDRRYHRHTNIQTHFLFLVYTFFYFFTVGNDNACIFSGAAIILSDDGHSNAAVEWSGGAKWANWWTLVSSRAWGQAQCRQWGSASLLSSIAFLMLANLFMHRSRTHSISMSCNRIQCRHEPLPLTCINGSSTAASTFSAVDSLPRVAFLCLSFTSFIF